MCSPCVPQAKAASQAKCTRVAGGSGCLPAAQEAVLRPPPHPQDCSFPRGPAAPGPMMSRPRALRLSQLLRSIAVCVCACASTCLGREGGLADTYERLQGAQPCGCQLKGTQFLRAQ